MNIVIAMILASSLIATSGAEAAPKKATSVRAVVRIFDAEQVSARLLEAGLPLGDVSVHTAATDPNRLLGRPGYYTSKADFRDMRHKNDDLGGWDGDNHTIEVFPNTASALTRKLYVDRVTKGVPFLTQYQILHGRVLIRFDRVMLPDEVQEYRVALDKILR